MSDLNPKQFEPKKPRWVPDKNGVNIKWHILGEHIKRNEKGAKGLAGKSKLDFDHWHQVHMDMHANGEFEVGEEHQHFTPASWKKNQKKKR